MNIGQRIRRSPGRLDQRVEDRAQPNMLLVYLTMTLLFVAAFLVYSYNLGAQPLWLDEGTTWELVTQNSVWSLMIDIFRPSQSYPLYHLLLKPVTLVLGDSEWALRLPSAITGALAVSTIFVLGRELRGWVLGIASAVLLIVSPFALWQVQDTKVYSFALLMAVLLALTLARALRRSTRGDWLLFGAVVVLLPFVHRFLLFNFVGCLVVWVLTSKWRYKHWALLAIGLLGIAMVGALVFAQDYFSAGVQFAQVDPIRAAWRTFFQFSTGLWRRQIQPEWLIPLLLLPFGAMLILGGARLLVDVWKRRNVRGALIVLALGGIPALLFALLLSLRPFYAPRYMTVMLPFWILALAWSLPEPDEFRSSKYDSQKRSFRSWWVVGTLVLWCWAGAASVQALVMPNAGIFSGSVVKEDFRGALEYLAEHAEPDELLILHPYYITPMYDYYAPRISDGQLPPPNTYPHFRFEPNFTQEDFEAAFRIALQNHERAWLLIAPAHASVHDRPEEDEELGVVGTTFQQGIDEWEPCQQRSEAEFVEVHVYCIERR
jgi:mannosyltransferase